MVFWYFYGKADGGLFELRASVVAHDLGISRRSVYNSLLFLTRVKLVKVQNAVTGRGKHSTYVLNWRKSKKVSQKCARQDKYIKTLNTPLGDTLPQTWKGAMCRIRQMMEYTCFEQVQEARQITRLIGNILKTLPKTRWQSFYEKLKHLVPELVLPSYHHEGATPIFNQLKRIT